MTTQLKKLEHKVYVPFTCSLYGPVNSLVRGMVWEAIRRPIERITEETEGFVRRNLYDN